VFDNSVNNFHGQLEWTVYTYL